MGRLVCPSCGKTFGYNVTNCPDDKTQLMDRPETPDFEATVVAPRAVTRYLGGAWLCQTPGCEEVMSAAEHTCPSCGAPAGTTSPDHPESNVLTLVLPNGVTEPLAIDEEVLLGRMSPIPAIARVLLPYPQTSRRHALLWVTDGEIHVQDEESTGGTWLDGVRAQEHTSKPLAKAGHTIEVPRGIVFRVELGDKSA